MIAPDFRVTENIDIMKAAKNFISYNYGILTNPLI